MTTSTGRLVSLPSAVLSNGPVRWPAPITSYDIHIYYLHKNKRDTTEAMELCEQIVAKFESPTVITRVFPYPVGPHPVAFIEVDIFDPLDFVRMVPWLALHHKERSILFHPNSGDELADHTTHALWLGPKFPLDYDTLDSPSR